MRRAATVTVALALTAVASACSSGAKPKAKATTSTASTASTSTSSTSATTSASGSTTSVAATSTTVSGPVHCETGISGTATGTSNATRMLLGGVTVAVADACRDAVRFSFFSPTTAAPAYRIEYVSGPFTAGGSGKPVAVAGAAFLRVRFRPAWTYDPDTAMPSFRGNDRVPLAGGRVVTEAVMTDQSEGVVEWIVGLKAKAKFAVTTTTSPPTLTLTVG